MVCVNSSLKITCNANSITLVWMLIPGQENSSNIDPETYTPSNSMEDVKMIGDFVLDWHQTIHLYPLLLWILLNSNIYNGTVLRCANYIVYEWANESAEIIIVLKGKLFTLFLYTGMHDHSM